MCGLDERSKDVYHTRESKSHVVAMIMGKGKNTIESEVLFLRNESPFSVVKQCLGLSQSTCGSNRKCWDIWSPGLISSLECSSFYT